MKFVKLFFAVALMASCGKQDTTIKIKGSDTEVNLAVQLAETFHEKNAAFFVSISGGGSGLGIASLLNGTGDVANSSRSIKQEELDLFRKRHLDIDSFIFAQDAVAFVVAEDLPIDSISVDDLGALLSGRFKDWSKLTGKSLPVNIYGRQSNSGTHDFVKNRLNIEFSPYAKQMNGNAQILEGIKADHSGIGYVGAGYVIHGGTKGIKVLPISAGRNEKAISPFDTAMITAGKYYFQRPLFQYYKRDTYPKVKSFFDFEASDTGQEIIRVAGYYPVKK